MAHMLYVEVVLLPRGEVVDINPLQVLGIKGLEGDHPRTSLLFAVGEWVVMGDRRLVKALLSGDEEAMKTYDKKYVKPAKKEGPRKVQVADPTDGGVLIGKE